MGRRKICNCSKLIAAIDAYIEKADKDIEDNLKDSGFVEPKKTVKKMTELEEDLTDILEEDTKFIVSTIQDYDGVQDYVAQKWPEVQNREDVVRKLTRTFESTFNDVIPEYVESYIKRTDADLSAIALTHRTQNWVNSWSSQLADLMRLSDNKNIQNILNNALQNGESVQDTANAIADSGIRSPGYRARRVATTELLRAHSVAQQESFMQSPAVEEKMWRHSGWRKYARQNHMNMDGQRVRKDLPFTLFGEEGGIHYPMYPRDAVLPPGESVNCGCIAEPIVNEYVLGMSLEERQKLQQEAIEQLDDEFDKMLDEQNKGDVLHMSKGDYKSDLNDAEVTLHSVEEQKELVKYASDRGIKIHNIGDFDGDSTILKDQIDAVAEIKDEFKINKKITISFKNMESGDLGQTSQGGDSIRFNKLALRDREITDNYLNEDRILAATDVKGISYHEMGHVLSKVHGEVGLEVAQQAYYNLYNKRISSVEMLDYLKSEVSSYSVTRRVNSKRITSKAFKEITPEMLSKDRTNPNDFSNEFIRVLKERYKL